MKHLVTTAFPYPPSVPPPFPNNSLTLKSPPRNELKAWREWESKPPPKTPEEASRHVISRPDIDGLLFSFYGLPLPHSVVEAPPLSDGLKFHLHSLPVDAKAVADGDTLTVYVSTSDALESSRVPPEVQMAVVERDEACAEKNYTKAVALHKQITNAGYRVLHINNQDILARKYRIRLRGIDAPESSMLYGKEAKDELVKMVDGKCLKILIFDEDRYGRFVGDVYCNGIFVQESLLKKGLAWHYTDYDKRPELEKWEKDAQAKRVGLWASSNPEMPWEWRKNRRANRHPTCIHRRS